MTPHGCRVGCSQAVILGGICPTPVRCYVVSARVCCKRPVTTGLSPTRKVKIVREVLRREDFYGGHHGNIGSNRLFQEELNGRRHFATVATPISHKFQLPWSLETPPARHFIWSKTGVRRPLLKCSLYSPIQDACTYFMFFLTKIVTSHTNNNEIEGCTQNKSSHVWNLLLPFRVLCAVSIILSMNQPALIQLSFSMRIRD